MSRLLTLGECAERTNTSLRWWRRAVFEKRVPVVRLNRLVRIREDDLEIFIETHREPAREEVGIVRRPRRQLDEASGQTRPGRTPSKEIHAVATEPHGGFDEPEFIDANG
jgi:excisionase family DNA binding protein